MSEGNSGTSAMVLLIRAALKSEAEHTREIAKSAQRELYSILEVGMPADAEEAQSRLIRSVRDYFENEETEGSGHLNGWMLIADMHELDGRATMAERWYGSFGKPWVRLGALQHVTAATMRDQLG